MQILQGLSDLYDDVTTQIFAEVGQSNNLMEELASWAEFKDDVVVLARFGKVDELDNIRVIQLPHDLHFFEDIGSLRGEEQKLAVSLRTRSRHKCGNAWPQMGLEKSMRTSTTLGCFLKSG